MLSRLFATLLLCAAALNANAGFYRFDAIDAFAVAPGNPPVWPFPGPIPSSMTISFLMDTGTAIMSMNPACPADPAKCLGDFHSDMSATILDVALGGTSIIHNEAAAGHFGGDTPHPKCVGCIGQTIVAGFSLTNSDYKITLQFDSHHAVTWAELLAAPDPTGLMFATMDRTPSPAFTINGPWGYFFAGASRVTVTAVPEPSTYGMLIAGLLIVGRVARRKFGA